MPLLLGTAPNQVPTNGDLGTMAFQDAVNYGSRTAPNVIEVNSSSDALRITQTGAGNAILIEDSANPDTTPFVVDAIGRVGVGTTLPNTNFEVVDFNPSIVARSSITTGAALVGAFGSDYFSTPSYRGVLFFQHNSASTGTTMAYSNANLGKLIFQNGSGALIYTNGNNTMAFGTAATERIAINGAGTVTIGAAAGSESLRITPVTSSVNYVSVFGSTTGGQVTIASQGSDTNVGINFNSKGQGTQLFNVGAYTVLRLDGGTSSYQSNLQIYGTGNGSGTGILVLNALGADANVNMLHATKGLGRHDFTCSGAIQLMVTATASAVNYVQVTGAVTSGVPAVAAQGSDTNVSLAYQAKASGYHYFQTNSVSQFVVAPTVSAVNYLQVTGAITTASPAISAAGSDANIDLKLTPKGTGVVQYGTLTANADAAITGYITIKDAGGTLRKLAVIA